MIWNFYRLSNHASDKLNHSFCLNPIFTKTFFMLKFAHMYAKNQLPNRYGRKNVDLSGIHIPAAHKEWFARDFLARNHTGVHWDTTYNLPKNTTACLEYIKVLGIS